MKTRDQLLEECMVSLEAGTATLEECVQRSFAADPDGADILRTIVALRTVSVPAHQVEGARERVRALISELPSAAPATVGSAIKGARWSRVWRRGARREIGRWRSLALAAAVLLVCALGTWQTLNAAGAALPGSPLYAVKRGAEWIELRSAWSDQRRGEVLAATAAQRLAEARAEAARHDDVLVRSLTRELDSTMRQLISLTAHMKAQHEDTTVVARALARDLGAEFAAMQSARQLGQTAFAQALNASTAAQQQAIKQYNLSLPAVGGDPSNSSPGAPHASPQGNGSQGSPTKSPTKSPPTPPPASPPASHGGISQGGSGQSAGKGQGGGNGRPPLGGGGHGSAGAAEYSHPWASSPPPSHTVHPGDWTVSPPGASAQRQANVFQLKGPS